MANLSSWARSSAQSFQYLLDAVGHDVASGSGRACHALAVTHLAMAERAAHTPQEQKVCLQIRNTLNALHPNKNGVMTE